MHRKLISLFSVLFTLAALLAGCAENRASTAAPANGYVDGSYYAEFADFDSRGYKDTLQVTVENGRVVSITFDAVNEAGGKKSQDEDYIRRMENAQNTTPARYTGDLVNQYLERQHSTEVVPVAGATYSSQSFTALLAALEPRMETGDTTPIAVENIPEL